MLSRIDPSRFLPVSSSKNKAMKMVFCGDFNFRPGQHLVACFDKYRSNGRILMMYANLVKVIFKVALGIN